MMPPAKTNDDKTASRRHFMKTTATLAGGAMAIGALASPPAVHAAGDDVLKVGLIG
jgi:hypothetical protein